MRTHSEILKDIKAFSSLDGDWRGLDALLNELWDSGTPQPDALPILFGVFERFPEDDGAGVFWAIVHGVEGLPLDYEPALQVSHQRCPSLMSEIMMRRLANARGAA